MSVIDWDRHMAAVRAFYAAQFAPGAGHIHDASDLAVDHASGRIVLGGRSFAGELAAGPSDVLALWSEHDGLLPWPGGERGRLPAISSRGVLAWATPTGIALAPLDAPDERRTVAIDGVIEAVAWSRDGARLLMVVAGRGADTAGIHGGLTLSAARAGAGGPEILTPDLPEAWRRAWVLDDGQTVLRPLSPLGVNVWEAAWAGGDVVVVASDAPGEGAWYRASLRLIRDGVVRELHRPADQIALPVASPDGATVLFVEAFASDRGLVCGTLKALDLATGRIRPIDTGAFEVSSIEWTGAQAAVAGMRGRETIAGTLSGDGPGIEWRSDGVTCGGWFPRAFGRGDGVVVVTEDYGQPPRLCAACGGELATLYDFAAPDAAAAMEGAGVVRWIEWQAPDGWAIDGVLIEPAGNAAPAPLVVDVHGGPVWASRRRWAARGRATPLLARMGARVLYPNPRGSAGYGQPFARAVKGDMGGADAADILAGVDALVAAGLADPARIATTGSSYGGFMSCWLIARDGRFAAAAPISPVTNWTSQHGTSQIPFFDAAFLDGSPYDPHGPYPARSPINFAGSVRMPTLLLAGGRDRNTPPTQALEFYTALAEQGTETALLTYADEGHSIRGFPGYFDSAGRVLAWFARHLGL